MKVKLEYQYFEGCPNHELMHSNMITAIIGLEDKIEIYEVHVEDEEKAKEVGFIGSPTLLINGADIDGVIPLSIPRLSCRYYSDGIPSIEKIRDEILNQLNKES
jgi:glutaredoxin